MVKTVPLPKKPGENAMFWPRTVSGPVLQHMNLELWYRGPRCPAGRGGSQRSGAFVESGANRDAAEGKMAFPAWQPHRISPPLILRERLVNVSTGEFSPEGAVDVRMGLF